MDFLAYCPPCFMIFFINNNHVYFQFHKICRCIMYAFIIYCNINWLFRIVNGIFNFFIGKYSGYTLDSSSILSWFECDSSGITSTSTGSSVWSLTSTCFIGKKSGWSLDSSSSLSEFERASSVIFKASTGS